MNRLNGAKGLKTTEKIQSVKFCENFIKYNIPILKHDATMTEVISTWLKFNKFGISYVLALIEPCKYCKYAKDLLDSENINYIVIYPPNTYGNFSRYNNQSPAAIMSLLISISGHLIAKYKRYNLYEYSDTSRQLFYSEIVKNNYYWRAIPKTRGYLKYKKELATLILQSKIDNGGKTWPYIIGKNGFIPGGFDELHRQYLQTETIKEEEEK